MAWMSQLAVVTAVIFDEPVSIMGFHPRNMIGGCEVKRQE